MQLNPHHLLLRSEEILNAKKQPSKDEQMQSIARTNELAEWNKSETTKKFLVELEAANAILLEHIADNGALCDEKALRAMCVESSTLTRVIKAMKVTGKYER